MRIFLQLLAVFATAIMPFSAPASGQFIEGGPQNLSETRSLGDLIRQATAPVQISFVHGMRADGPGASDAFRAGLLRRLGGRETGPVRRFLDLGAWPDQARLGTIPIWPTAVSWTASRPFVDRYTLALRNGKAVVVDEINWWPLVFPLKCRFLVLPEHDLSGNDVDHLRLCAGQPPRRPRIVYHPWISEDELNQAVRTRPRSGGGADVNGGIKRDILNWGLSDAVIALGPMRHYLALAMQQAFGIAVEGVVAGTAQDHVLIAESLGSFIVLDASRAGAAAVDSYLDRSRDIYLFANQFALLEFGRIANIPDGSGGPPAASTEGSLLAELGERADAPAPPRAPRRRLQIIALSDPSDLLTFRLPAIPDAIVVNVYVRNAGTFAGLANPVRAHTGHADNSAVWEVLLQSRFDD